MKTITFKKNNIELDLKFSIEENTVWLSQKDLGILFNRSIKSIAEHISKLPKTCPTFRKIRIVADDGRQREINHYNLDIITKVGYKIDPILTMEFVNWCNEQLNSRNNQLFPIESSIIRFNNGEIALDVTVEQTEDTVYLSQDQLAILFDTTKQNISFHVINILSSGELDKGATVKDFLTVQNENGRSVNR